MIYYEYKKKVQTSVLNDQIEIQKIEKDAD